MRMNIFLFAFIMADNIDFRKQVTNDIIALLERGTAPWVRPWDMGEAGLTPLNATTGKKYKGGNILSLFITSMRKGYGEDRKSVV